MGKKHDQMSLLEHIGELRTKLIVSVIAIIAASVVCFMFYDRLYQIFFRPFEGLENENGQKLFINYIYEGFMLKFKLSIIAGIVLSFPIHMYNILSFIFPGLTKKESRIIAICLIAALALAVLGFYYGYFYIVPISIRFLSGSGFIPEGVGMLLNFDRNIFYILQFMLVSVLVFQLPVILEVLLILNIIDRKALLKASRYIIVGIFILSALFTPPDFISQIAVAVPLIALFFITILIAYIFRFGNGGFEDA